MVNFLQQLSWGLSKRVMRSEVKWPSWCHDTGSHILATGTSFPLGLRTGSSFYLISRGGFFKECLALWPRINTPFCLTPAEGPSHKSGMYSKIKKHFLFFRRSVEPLASSKCLHVHKIKQNPFWFIISILSLNWSRTQQSEKAFDKERHDKFSYDMLIKEEGLWGFWCGRQTE